MKIQPTAWEKILTNDMTDKGLISNLYKQLTTQHQKNDLKIGRRPEQTLFQRRNAGGQQAHEKMLNIANHQENANQNHSEIITSHLIEWLSSNTHTHTHTHTQITNIVENVEREVSQNAT